MARPTPESNIQRVLAMPFAAVYPHYLTKVQRKARTKDELDEVIRWLTGYSQQEFQVQLDRGTAIRLFFEHAPAMHPARELVTGVVCGVRVEAVVDPVMRECRRLDKLVDELAKGRPMERILRTAP